MLFPLYAMRKYTEVRWEGMYRVIQTHRNMWVLDHKYKTNKNYWERRLELEYDSMRPYPIYPLKKKFSNISQMLKHPGREFIDSTGQLLKYTKQTFYPIKYAKIEAIWKTQRGHTAIKSSEVPTTFVVVDYKNQPYFSYIKMGRCFILFDLEYEIGHKKRIKI